jgi:hypothetical protein
MLFRRIHPTTVQNLWKELSFNPFTPNPRTFFTKATAIIPAIGQSSMAKPSPLFRSAGGGGNGDPWPTIAMHVVASLLP